MTLKNSEKKHRLEKSGFVRPQLCEQKYGGTPKSSILIGFSIINHWKHPYVVDLAAFFLNWPGSAAPLEGLADFGAPEWPSEAERLSPVNFWQEFPWELHDRTDTLGTWWGWSPLFGTHFVCFLLHFFGTYANALTTSTAKSLQVYMVYSE